MTTSDHEKKRASHDDALRFSEARYRALFHDNPTMIVTLDAELSILSVNPICARQLGYTIDELEGHSVLRLFHEDDRSAVAEQLRRSLQKPYQVYHWQFRKVRKDGGLLWVEETAQAVYDLNGALNLLVVCQDITERKQMEEALRESEKKFSQAFQTMPSALVISSLTDGRYKEVNEAFERMIGYRRDELLGRSALELNIWQNPEDRTIVLRMLASGEKVHDLEINFRSKSGVILVGLYSAELIEIGAEPCLLSMVNDISAHKEAEEVIKRLNSDLATHAAELEAANMELEAFNYSVAHDLRNPLNVISSYCQVMKELCAAHLDAQCRGYLQKAYNSTLNMNRLIEALLNFSRIGHVEPHRAMVDLSALAEEVVTMLKLTDPERQVDFRIAAGMTAHADATLLRVVLNNLLDNAWKYTGLRKEAVITFGATQIDGNPVYFFRDNGAGFNMTDAEKLFLPFQRLPGAEEQRGFGIGLATVERIIRRHGGRVWAEGEPDNGATFYFTLQP